MTNNETLLLLCQLICRELLWGEDIVAWPTEHKIYRQNLKCWFPWIFFEYWPFRVTLVLMSSFDQKYLRMYQAHWVQRDFGVVSVGTSPNKPWRLFFRWSVHLLITHNISLSSAYVLTFQRRYKPCPKEQLWAVRPHFVLQDHVSHTAPERHLTQGAPWRAVSAKPFSLAGSQPTPWGNNWGWKPFGPKI